MASESEVVDKEGEVVTQIDHSPKPRINTDLAIEIISHEGQALSSAFSPPKEESGKRQHEEDGSPSPTLEEEDDVTPTAVHKRINFAAGATTLVMPPVELEAVIM